MSEIISGGFFYGRLRRAHSIASVALGRAQSVVCVYKTDKKCSIYRERGIWVMSESNEGKKTQEIKFGCRQSSQKKKS